MPMDTNDLINQLSQKLEPVKPLAPAPVRAFVFSLLVLLIVFASVFFIDALRPTIIDRITHANSTLFAETVLMLLAGVLATLSAFRLHVPDTRLRMGIILPLVLATLSWLGVLYVCCKNVALLDIAHDMAHEPMGGYHCLTDLALILIIPAISAVPMLRRAAPVHHALLGFSTALALASFCAIAMRYICRDDGHAHLLLWHFLPVFALAILGVILGTLLPALRRA